MVVIALVAQSCARTAVGRRAFVLGAVVSPTDPIGDRDHAAARRAASNPSRSSRARASSTALVAYRVAVVAAVSGTFSLWEAGLSFVFNVVGGVIVGLGVAWIVRQVRRRLDFPPPRC